MRKGTFTFEVDLDNPEQVEAAMNAIQSVASEGTVERKPKKKVKEEDEELDEEEETTEDEITTEDLRELTKEKAAIHDRKHREKIKEKLETLGAKGVSDLKEKHYATYHSYLQKLK